jgi:methyl-accepting chemotaxis protein
MVGWEEANDQEHTYRLAPGAGFAVVLVFSMVVAAVGIWRLKTVAQQTQQMMDVPLKTERLVSQWNTLLLIAIQRTTTVVKSRDPELEAFLAKAAASSKESAQTLKDVEQLLTSEEEKKLFAAINAARKQFLAIRDQIYAAKKEGDAAKVDQLYQQQYVGIANNTQGAMRSLLDFERARIDEISADIQSDAASSQWQIFALEAVILACGIAFALLLTRSITRRCTRRWPFRSAWPPAT